MDIPGRNQGSEGLFGAPIVNEEKPSEKNQWKTGIEGSRVSGKGYYHSARKQIVEIEAMPLELEVAASGKLGGGIAYLYRTIVDILRRSKFEDPDRLTFGESTKVTPVAVWSFV